MNTVRLTKNAFNDLQVSLDRQYVELSGIGRPGRPTRLVDKRMLLSLILYMYASKSDLITLCELFSCPPSTTGKDYTQIGSGTGACPCEHARYGNPMPSTEE